MGCSGSILYINDTCTNTIRKIPLTYSVGGISYIIIFIIVVYNYVFSLNKDLYIIYPDLALLNNKLIFCEDIVNSSTPISTT